MIQERKPFVSELKGQTSKLKRHSVWYSKWKTAHMEAEFVHEIRTPGARRRSYKPSEEERGKFRNYIIIGLLSSAGSYDPTLQKSRGKWLPVKNSVVSQIIPESEGRNIFWQAKFYFLCSLSRAITKINIFLPEWRGVEQERGGNGIQHRRKAKGIPRVMVKGVPGWRPKTEWSRSESWGKLSLRRSGTRSYLGELTIGRII